MAWAVWVTGLPGSGKTSVARCMASLLENKGVHAKILEMDAVRKVLTPRPTYSEEERDIVYAALAYMAKLLVDEGVNVIVDATANLRKYRDMARSLITDYGEIYVRCPMELCMEREAARKGGYAPKDIYKKGMTGKSATVPGLNVPYEAPENPLAIVDTDRLSPEEAGKIAAEAIIKKFGETHG